MLKIIFPYFFCALSVFATHVSHNNHTQPPIVTLLTDFGTSDGAVSAMKGVIYTISSKIRVEDVTHDIEAYDINSAGYILNQVSDFYPKGTIFVCVVDPGVGTKRKSVVVRFKNGSYYVGPDNGTLTCVAKKYGIEEVREIAPHHRLNHKNSGFHTFFGRDIFAFIAGKMAAGSVLFEEVGPRLQTVVTYKIQAPIVKDNTIVGRVEAFDGAFGNLWTNVSYEHVEKINGSKKINLVIKRSQKEIYSKSLSFCQTFGNVHKGEALVYINSLGDVAIALNQGNFKEKFKIQIGDTIYLSKKD